MTTSTLIAAVEASLASLGTLLADKDICDSHRDYYRGQAQAYRNILKTIDPTRSDEYHTNYDYGAGIALA